MESQLKICQELKPFRELDLNDNVIEGEQITSIEKFPEYANILESFPNMVQVLEQENINDEKEEIAKILEPFPDMVRHNILQLFYFIKMIE